MTGLTQKFGIPYPDSQTQVYRLGDELRQMAGGVEAALIAAGVPAVTNLDRAVCPTVAARDAHFGVPSTPAARLALQTRGAECVRLDTGYTERYYADYDAAANPGGATPAGWYPTSGALPYAVLRRPTAAIAVPNQLAALIPFGETSTSHVGGGMIATQSGVRVPLAGVYAVEASIIFDLNGSGLRFAMISRNGKADADRLAYGPLLPGVSIAYNPAVTAAKVRLAAGDLLNVYAWQSSGAALNIMGAPNASQTHIDPAQYLSVKFISPAH